MLDEVLAYLVPQRSGSLLADCTLGEGGHAQAFLERYPELRCIGIDADRRIQARARERLARFGERAGFLSGYFDEILAEWAGGAPDLVLFDLGISMYHFAEAERGFGWGKDEPLDMRLSDEAPRSAAEILATEREEELARLIFEYGEERFSRRIAGAIVEARRKATIATSGRLAELVTAAVPASYRHGRIHPATRTFQALRIAVNDELGRAERGIRLAVGLLAPKGRIGVISFHSLEDRIAKNVFRELAGKGNPAASSIPGRHRPISEAGERESGPCLELVTKKPIEPSAEEIARNPASRSAKLRVARKIGPGKAVA
jgi:16S rRNA (cytosine1402-N4)-methyltransferase